MRASAGEMPLTVFDLSVCCFKWFSHGCSCRFVFEPHGRSCPCFEFPNLFDKRELDVE